MPRPSERQPVMALPWLLALAALAVAVALFVARPFSAAPVGFDTQASVLYFERIIAGQRLEQFVSTTPKPVLTVLYGVLHAATGDWRPLIWATVVAFATATVLIAVLAARLAGPIAGVFTGVALAGSRVLVEEVAFGNAVPWALLGWAAAGLAVTAPRPRFGLAAVAVLLAALVRIETLVVVGVAIGALLVAEVGWRRQHLERPSRRAWLLLLGLLAIPIMMVHDLALTGDPWYWAGVAVRYSEVARAVRDVPEAVELAGWIAGRYAAWGGLVLLAILGAVRLVRERQWAVALGLAALGPGVMAFLVLLAARGTYVPERYVAPIDVAIILAAGIGLTAIGLPEGWLGAGWRPEGWLPAGRPGVAHAGPLAGVVAAVVAVALATPYAPFETQLREVVSGHLILNQNVGRVLPTLSEKLGMAAGQPILVPRPVWPRIVVDLGASLTQFDATDTSRINPGTPYPAVGQVVYHDRYGDRRAERLGLLENETPTTFGPGTLVPLLADPARGIWVSELRPGGS